MFLVAPLSWIHHLVFILPATIIGLRHFLSNYKSSISIRCIGMLVCALLIYVNISFSHLWSVKIQGLTTLAVSIKFYAVFALWILLLIENAYSSRAVALPVRSNTN